MQTVSRGFASHHSNLPYADITPAPLKVPSYSQRTLCCLVDPTSVSHLGLEKPGPNLPRNQPELPGKGRGFLEKSQNEGYPPHGPQKAPHNTTKRASERKYMESHLGAGQGASPKQMIICFHCGKLGYISHSCNFIECGFMEC